MTVSLTVTPFLRPHLISRFHGFFDAFSEKRFSFLAGERQATLQYPPVCPLSLARIRNPIGLFNASFHNAKTQLQPHREYPVYGKISAHFPARAQPHVSLPRSQIVCARRRCAPQVFVHKTTSIGTMLTSKDANATGTQSFPKTRGSKKFPPVWPRTTDDNGVGMERK